jgi:tetratricopeptide (TPR) repeat protein
MDKLIAQILDQAHKDALAGRSHETIFSLEKLAVEALNVLGITYFGLAETEHPGLDYLKMSLVLDRGNWMVHSNIAHCLNRLGRFKEASLSAEEAVKWSGDASADPYYNGGVIYSNLKQTKRAIDFYEQAIRIEPNRPIFHFNYGCELLKDGQFDKGWKEYEYRLDAFEDIKKITRRFTNVPRWDGNKIDRLLIYSEQGIGDLINFMRFIPQVKKKCNHITLEAQEAMKGLLENAPGIDTISYRGDENYPEIGTEFDAVVSICSLPYHCKCTDQIPKRPYIHAPKRPRPEEMKPDKKNIGIIWAGNPHHPSDSTRSIYLNSFRSLSDLPDTRLFSLQKNPNLLRQWEGKSINLLEGSLGMWLICLLKWRHF